jgi:NADPH:quinone reductase-like Zn-dependent oxidoreductase
MPQAVRISQYGDPDVLEVVDVPDPQPGPGRVRLRVRAAGVNPADTKLRRGLWSGGKPLAEPRGLGFDVAGVVDALGEGVTGLAIGDEVFGASAGPAYGELALADPAKVFAKPAEVPWEVAGGLGVAGRAAYRALELLGVRAGDTLLVLAAAGSVGILASQLAVARGARVIGTAGPGNQEFVEGLGVTPVVYGEGLRERVLAVAPDGVDAVLDGSGRGELADSVALAGGPERVITLAADDAAEHGVTFSSSDGDVDTSSALPEIARLIADGRLRFPVWRTYGLRDVREAHRASEAGHLTGKIVLVP